MSENKILPFPHLQTSISPKAFPESSNLQTILAKFIGQSAAITHLENGSMNIVSNHYHTITINQFVSKDYLLGTYVPEKSVGTQDADPDGHLSDSDLIEAARQQLQQLARDIRMLSASVDESLARITAQETNRG